MKIIRPIAAVAILMAATAASAENGQRFDFAAQNAAYANGRGDSSESRQCFNGRSIASANTADGQLYVQSAHGGVYRMRLTGDCASLVDARSLALRSDTGDTVCPGESARLMIKAASGASQCRVSDVRKVTSREAAALSVAATRR